jgi:hypothetical protein
VIPPSKRKRQKKDADPTGVREIDLLSTLSPCGIKDYLAGVSAYVRQSSGLQAGPKKAAQIRLSSALARALAEELVVLVPRLKNRLVTYEQKVAGGLRTANADVSESHRLDGLRLAVELKPINLAVGRAIWNRFGDIRTFAVNIHLKFPFAVVGGVLVIPTYEETGTKEASKAETVEEIFAEGDPVLDAVVVSSESDHLNEAKTSSPTRKSTIHLIERAIDRLERAGGRKGEAEPAHLLEGIAVLVYDPDTGLIDQNLPRSGSGLRWEDFILALATAYKARFED